MNLATVLGIPSGKDTIQDEGRPVIVRVKIEPPERILLLQQELARRNDWLLIIDNAESLSDVEAFLPQEGRGHLLITSRNPAWSGAAESVSVDLLSQDVAADVLLFRTSSTDRPAASRLADQLGRLPLALEQAAAYAADQRISLAHYLDLFRSRQADLLKRGKPLAYNGTVDTVVSLTIEALKRKNPLALVLLEMCALLAPDEIPVGSIIQSTVIFFRMDRPDALARTEAIGELHRAGLLVGDVGGTARLHRLFQTVVLSQIPPALYFSRVDGIASVLLESLRPEIQEHMNHSTSLLTIPPAYARLRPHVSSILKNGRGRVHALSLACLLELSMSGLHLGHPAVEELYLEAREIRRIVADRERSRGPRQPNWSGRPRR